MATNIFSTTRTVAAQFAGPPLRESVGMRGMLAAQFPQAVVGDRFRSALARVVVLRRRMSSSSRGRCDLVAAGSVPQHEAGDPAADGHAAGHDGHAADDNGRAADHDGHAADHSGYADDRHVGRHKSQASSGPIHPRPARPALVATFPGCAGIQLVRVWCKTRPTSKRFEDGA